MCRTFARTLVNVREVVWNVALWVRQSFGDRKGITKKLCDKDFAERSGELSGAICLKTLALVGNDLVAPSNSSESSLVLFVRFFGFVSPSLGNGRNTVSRVLFQKRELTEFCGRFGEFCEKLDGFALVHKKQAERNSLSADQLGEGQKTH